MTVHRIILDTLWTIAREALRLSENTVNLLTTTPAKTKLAAFVLGWGVFRIMAIEFSQRIREKVIYLTPKECNFASS
jgi:hypothetical protein